MYQSNLLYTLDLYNFTCLIYSINWNSHCENSMVVSQRKKKAQGGGGGWLEKLLIVLEKQKQKHAFR